MVTQKIYAEGMRAGEPGVPHEKTPDPALGCQLTSQPNLHPRQKVYRRLEFGFCPDLAPLSYDGRDPATVRLAFLNRLLGKAPTIDPDMMTRFYTFVVEYVKRYPKIAFVDFDAWIESTNYTTERKEELKRIMRDACYGPLSAHDRSIIKSFVKREFYLAFKAPRTINSRNDAFKGFCGAFFAAMEAIVYQDHHFIKHVPVPDRTALISGLRGRGTKYYVSDHHQFEKAFSPELMQNCEFVLYRHLAGHHQGLAVVLDTLAGLNRLSTHTGVKVKLRGRRMSGEMNTSLGNGFSNLMSALFMAELNGSKIDGYVEGDDGIFAVTRLPTAAQYAKLGFDIDIKEISDPTKASFCGLVFADSGQVIRNPFKFLAGFGWTHSFIHAGPKIMNELLMAKALSACYETGQCPIIGAVARAAIAFAGQCRPRYELGSYKRVPEDYKVPPYNPSMDTRELFAELYGISIQQQLQYEARVASGHIDQLDPALEADVLAVQCLQYYASTYVVAA